MKKVLSLVLVLAMVFGMSAMAFAADGALNKGSGAGKVDFGITATGGYNIATTLKPGDEVAIVLKNANLSTTGVTLFNGFEFATYSLSAGLEGIFEFGGARNTVASNSLAQGLLGEYAPTKTATNGTGEMVIWLRVKAGAPDGAFGTSGNLVLKDAANDAGTAAVNTLSLNISGRIGTSAAVATTTIPSNVKIIGIRDDAFAFPETDIDDFKGDESRTHTLIPENFVWEYISGTEKGQEVNHEVVMTWNKTDLKASHLTNITVRRTNMSNNAGTIKDVKIDGVNVKISTVKYFLKCGSTDGNFDLQLCYKNSAGGMKSLINFKIANDEELIEDSQVEVDTDSNIYVKADVSVRNVKMHAGEGLYITKSFGAGQKAYARVSLELSAGDEKLFQEFAELSDVYTLYTVGVASANVTVSFDDLADTYFVYDENYKLVGTTADTKLPFSNKYYLTTKKVDLTGGAAPDETPAESSSPSDTGNVPGGGGSTAGTGNGNYNPNTGR